MDPQVPIPGTSAVEMAREVSGEALAVAQAETKRHGVSRHSLCFTMLYLLQILTQEDGTAGNGTTVREEERGVEDLGVLDGNQDDVADYRHNERASNVNTVLASPGSPPCDEAVARQGQL